MDTEFLVEPAINDGQAFIEQLVREGWGISVAFWAKQTEEGLFRLYIACHCANEDSLNSLYDHAFRTLGERDRFDIRPSELKLISSDSSIAHDAKAIRDLWQSWRPRRVQNQTLGTLFVVEAIIYPNFTNRLAFHVTYRRDQPADSNRWQATTTFDEITDSGGPLGASSMSWGFWGSELEDPITRVTVRVTLALDPGITAEEALANSELRHCFRQQAEELADNMFRSKFPDAIIEHLAIAPLLRSGTD